MPLSKDDTLHAKGIAIIGMVLLHLFCRLGDLPYTPWIWIGDVPLIYYIGLFGDLCVPIYCFCSGYAHYLLCEKDGTNYARRIPGKVLRFLLNYWIVVILFSVIGLFFDKTNTIPGSFTTFLGNMLVVGMSYNGAWWFVTTYLFLLILSPIAHRIFKNVNPFLLLFLSGLTYFAAHMLRFDYVIELQNPVLQWTWNQLVLLGNTQFAYFLGMTAYACKILEKLRNFFDNPKKNLFRLTAVFTLPLAAFIGHAIVQSSIVSPITAMMVLTSLSLARLPQWTAAILSFFGKHSTNIWLVHMFFYLTLFKNLVFFAKYPLLIAALMFAICIIVSCFINFIYKPICNKLVNGG